MKLLEARDKQPRPLAQSRTEETPDTFAACRDI